MDRERILQGFIPTWLGRTLEVHGILSSTNDRARELLDQIGPEAHGAVILADGQRSGRGRFGRRWHSPPGLGLALSVALWPSAAADELACLTVAGSLAALRALQRTSGASPTLKWPNDVQLDGRKVAGVLLEGRWNGEAPAGFVLGIGVNLTHRPEDFPPELREASTSVLASTGRTIAAEEAAAALLTELGPLLELGLNRPRALLEAASPHWGHRRGEWLEVSAGDDRFRGRFVRVAQDGALVVRAGDGERNVRFGDVTRLRRAP
jgi:BirA family biotin operon repressor/biotin-[acetyl-CoA-carboxylase] ligase